jgi:hypothetical protein
MVMDNEIEAILKQGEPLNSTCKSLIQAALKSGGDDNVTVQVITFTADEASGTISRESYYLRSMCAFFGSILLIAVSLAFYYRQTPDRHPVVSLMWSGKETITGKTSSHPEDYKPDINEPAINHRNDTNISLETDKKKPGHNRQTFRLRDTPQRQINKSMNKSESANLTF